MLVTGTSNCLEIVSANESFICKVNKEAVGIKEVSADNRFSDINNNETPRQFLEAKEQNH